MNLFGNKGERKSFNWRVNKVGNFEKKQRRIWESFFGLFLLDLNVILRGDCCKRVSPLLSSPFSRGQRVTNGCKWPRWMKRSWKCPSTNTCPLLLILKGLWLVHVGKICFTFSFYSLLLSLTLKRSIHVHSNSNKSGPAFWVQFNSSVLSYPPL